MALKLTLPCNIWKIKVCRYHKQEYKHERFHCTVVDDADCTFLEKLPVHGPVRHSLAGNLSPGIFRHAVWLYLGLCSSHYFTANPSGRHSAKSRDLSRFKSNCECASLLAVYYSADCSHPADQVDCRNIYWYLGGDCTANHLCRALYWPPD